MINGLDLFHIHKGNLNINVTNCGATLVSIFLPNVKGNIIPKPYTIFQPFYHTSSNFTMLIILMYVSFNKCCSWIELFHLKHGIKSNVGYICICISSSSSLLCSLFKQLLWSCTLTFPIINVSLEIFPTTKLCSC